MSKPYNPTITIPRAGYTGSWREFVSDNAAFIPDHEIERLELSLKHAGTATHIASTAGEFVIEASK